MSITSEIRLRIKKEGDVALTQLSGKLNDVASRSVVSNKKFKDLAATLRKNDADIRSKSINALNDYSRAWRELANSVDVTSKEFREATREAQRFERESAKAQGRRGGGRFMRAAQGVGAVAAAGIFGGPEGFIGGLAGLGLGGVGGAAVGGAIGAYVKNIRVALGEVASFSAEIRRQEIALQGVAGTGNDYAFALEAINKATKDFAIPTSVLTREFTKLQASVQGAGGNVQDTDKTFRAIVASIRATGGSIEDVRSALTATAQVFSKGKVSAEELRQQIGERLPGAFTLFAESIGKTPAELDKALEKGEVSLQDFMKFVELLLDRYEKDAKKIASGPEAAGDRLKVVLENLKKTTGPILADIGASFQTFAAEAATAIDNLIKDLGKLGRKMEEKFGGKLLDNAIRNVIIQESLIKQLETEALVRVGGLTDEEKRQLSLAKKLRAGSLKVIEGSKFGPELPTAPSTLPSTPDKDKDNKIKTKVVSKEIYDLELKRNIAAREGNQLRTVQLDFEISRQKLLEDLNAKKISQNVYEIEVRREGERLAQKVDRIEKDRVKTGVVYQGILNNLLFSTQNLSEKEKERIENNQKLVPLIEAGMAAVDAGKISMKEFLDALREVKKLMEGDGEKTFGQTFNETFQEGIKNMGELAQNLGNSLAKAFGGAADALADFITTGKASFKDFARSVLQDLARIFIRAAMFNALKGIFQGSGFLGFASGGIMSNDGAFPLKRYARGGIANSPQLAMFGEGSTPEAYVPLPDGRTIPVTMKNGGKGMGNVVVNVDATGSSAEGDSQQANKLGEAIGVAVRQELIRQKRPGGLLA